MNYQLSVRELNRTEQLLNSITLLVVRSKRPGNILRNSEALVNVYRKKAKKPGELKFASSQAHRATEAVIAVLEFRRDAAARGHASDFDLVPPGSASRGSSRSGRWTVRIARG